MPKLEVPLKELGKHVRNILDKNNISYDEIRISKGEKQDDVDYIIAIFSSKKMPFNRATEIQIEIYKNLKEILNGEKFVVSYQPILTD